MPIVADFASITRGVPGEPGTFGTPFVIAQGGDSLKIPFSTGGRHHSPGLLSFMLRRLTSGTPNVRITTSQSNHVLGQLRPTSAADQHVWRHEQFAIPTNLLSGASGNANVVHFGVGGSNYELRDIVCFFHQEA